jgi:mRNA interferase HigB
MNAWYRITKRANWAHFAEVKATFNSADVYQDNIIIFDIGGNKFRLVAAIHYNTSKIYIREVLTHGEYEKGKWKKSL